MPSRSLAVSLSVFLAAFAPGAAPYEAWAASRTGSPVVVAPALLAAPVSASVPTLATPVALAFSGIGTAQPAASLPAWSATPINARPSPAMPRLGAGWGLRLSAKESEPTARVTETAKPEVSRSIENGDPASAKAELDGRWDGSAPPPPLPQAGEGRGEGTASTPPLTLPSPPKGGEGTRASKVGAWVMPPAAVLLATQRNAAWLKHPFLGQTGLTWVGVGAVAASSWLLAKVARSLTTRAMEKSRKDELLKGIAVNFAGLGVYAVGAVVAANLLGVDVPTTLTGLLALSGVAAAGLESPVGNFAGGLQLALQEPFNLGDRIQLGDSPEYQGVVSKVTIMKTTLKRRAQEKVGDTLVERIKTIHVPNSSFIGIVLIRFADREPELVEPRTPAPRPNRVRTGLGLVVAALPVALRLAVPAWGGGLLGWLSIFAAAGGAWLAGKVVSLLVERALARSKRDPMFKSIIATGASYLVYAAAGFLIAALLGVSPAGVGSSSLFVTLVTGWLLRGPIGDFIGTFILLNNRDFTVGDDIQIGAATEHRGLVRRIDYSYTRLAGAEKREILVPNSRHGKAVIITTK